MTKYVWTCDYCGKEFRTKKLSDDHELKCSMKNREITIKIKAPTRDTMFLFGSVFIVLYFLFYFVVSSYAESNGLPTLDLLQPHKWFRSETIPTATPLPTPSSIPTPTLVPTTKPKTKATTNLSTNTGSGVECVGPDGKHLNTSLEECEKLNKAWNKPIDYMVNCQISGNCPSETRRIKKSECDNGTCCQIGSNWIFYTSRDKCKQDQGSGGRSPNTNNNTGKVPVFLTSVQVTYYCPSQNVDAIKSIDTTITSQMEKLATDFNKCSDTFRATDGCWKTCKDTFTTGDTYSSCINKCPSPNTACDWVYLEQKNMISQINILCPE